jgi:amidase/6-aminohexanoate-cyclic-dimer hydrolase
MAVSPIPFEDYVRHDATALAAGVRNGDFTAAELVETAIARAEAVNPKINAISTPLYDEARAAAKEALSGPFAGTPFAMKDLNQGMAGVPLTNGSRAFADNVCPTDSETAKRYRKAGLLVIASSTTPEFGLTVTTESAIRGKTRNPWNLERVAGGSSGGAAALTAAGVLPMAHATDGGGSIRVPAACCGLFGLKVSRGRNPVGMGKTEGWSGLGVSHVVSRSVRDSAAALDASHGPEAGTRYVLEAPQSGFLAALDRAPRRLKIALQMKTWLGADPHPDCIAAIEDAARLCEQLGHSVEIAQPALDGAGLRKALVTTISAHLASTVAAREAQLGRKLTEDELEPVTQIMTAGGARASALDLIAADNIHMTAAQVMGEFMTGYDMILSPTLGEPPVPLGTVSLDMDPRLNGENIGRFSPFTAVHNQTGQPAMSVPLYWNAEGLPVGVMFAGRIGAEADLLALAAQLEQARPWFDRRPSL